MSRRRKPTLTGSSVRATARIGGGLMILIGVVSLILAPFLSESIFPKLWEVEPLAYIGAVLVMAGLGVACLTYVIPHALDWRSTSLGMDRETSQQWSQITQKYFELFNHDLGRPLLRILGKERELRAIFESSSTGNDPAVKELLDEIESQAPNFRPMMFNIQVRVQL